jgi:hypothetical protein
MRTEFCALLLVVFITSRICRFVLRTTGADWPTSAPKMKQANAQTREEMGGFMMTNFRLQNRLVKLESCSSSGGMFQYLKCAGSTHLREEAQC